MAGLNEEQKALAQRTTEELMPVLLAIHKTRGLNFEGIKERAFEDTATISLLIWRGHLLLKHKKGGTINDIIAKVKAENSKEDSSPSSKRFEVEGE